MKRSIILGILIIGFIGISIGVAAAQHGEGKDCPGANYVDADNDGVCDNFVDENKDGICDNYNGRDSDGDGIPNGQDDDYEPPRDGNGNGDKYRKGHSR